MSRRERVGGAVGNSNVPAVPLQSLWEAAASTTASATTDNFTEHQVTEVAAFALSPSPPLVPERPSQGQIDHSRSFEERDTAEVQTVAPADGISGFQASAGQDVQQGPVAGLLVTAKQLRASKDANPLRKQQHKVESRQPQQKHKKGTADVHLIGEVTGALGVGSESFYCTWQLVYDSQLWSVTKGLDKGRTHTSCPLLPEDGDLSGVVWETPIDLALTTSSLQHWPVLVFRLFHHSTWLGRDEFVGYSVCVLPNTPGCHHISCPVWAAVESQRSFKQDITSWFTGLTPQLVDESFVTDLEQRYEQGQHLHTRDCTSGSSSAISIVGGSSAAVLVTMPAAKAIDCIGGAAVQPGLYCRSFGTAGAGGRAAAGNTAVVPASGGLAGAGGRICLRLHLLARGLHELKLSGGESIGACLERLRDNVEKMRRHKERAPTAEEEAESEGVRLVREGRAARLAAVQQQRDGGSSRDQLLSGAEYGSSMDGSFSAGRASRAGRVSPNRDTLRLQGRDETCGSSSVAGSTNSLMRTGRFTSRDGEATDTAASTGTSAGRYSRAGRLSSSSPGRTAATLRSEDMPTSSFTPAAIRAEYSGVRPGIIRVGTASRDISSAGINGSGSSAGLRGSSSQMGQYTSAVLRSRGAAASPTEQQGSGDRSALAGVDLASAAAAGSPSRGTGLLLRRGAQLASLSQGVRRGDSGAGSGAGFQYGFDVAPLLPYGADSNNG